jgi:hypothetical protein
LSAIAITFIRILIFLVLLILELPTAASSGEGHVVEAVPLPLSGQSEQFLLTMTFCVLGAITIVLEFLLFYRNRALWSGLDFVVGVGTQTIIVAVIIVLGIGYNAEQSQPAFALLGTALGYLLGRGEYRRRSAQNGEVENKRQTLQDSEDSG